jgi:hypothetical protein
LPPIQTSTPIARPRPWPRKKVSDDLEEEEGEISVTIDHKDNDADLYMTPERSVIKPRFNDVARVVHRWNQEHKPLNALTTTIKKDKDGDE